ncbi:uncharacterized protein LOC141899018 [Tubulanus polymorphus]|uniref:uncharacterized protein LOC141899018 n=1 Tax=Tubulanus polymorphus TaxID=672921 RepID=UPI003DA69A05
MWKLRNHTDEEHVLTENEADMYIQIRNVYKDRSLSDKERRKLEFLKKVESLQTECAKEMNNQLRLKEIKEENKRHMQNEQLYFIRKRFLEEQVKRWRTQYVTVKVLQHEKNDRFLYGLPELFDEIPHYKTRARKRRKAVGADSKKNAQRYGQMFEHNPGPVVFRAKTPKMENYVIVEEKDDKDIEEEDAESTLSKSTRASLRSLDLDDQEDIFEKARRKYGIDVESESDDDDY